MSRGFSLAKTNIIEHRSLMSHLTSRLSSHTCPPTHSAWLPPHSVGQQCCGLSLLKCTHSSWPHLLGHTQVLSSCRRHHISGLSNLSKGRGDSLQKKNKKTQETATEVTVEAHRHNTGEKVVEVGF